MSAPESLRVVAAAIVSEGRCLVALRGASMRMAGYWELPGGKVEPNETGPDALVREIREELGLDVEVGTSLGTSPSTGDDGRPFVLEAFVARWRGGTLTLLEHAEARWCDPQALATLRWAPADVPFVPRVAALLRATT